MSARLRRVAAILLRLFYLLRGSSARVMATVTGLIYGTFIA